ncbi:MAG TPA: thioredoxin domain-containing protein [Gemmatimonadales bacterium]
MTPAPAQARSRPLALAIALLLGPALLVTAACAGGADDAGSDGTGAPPDAALAGGTGDGTENGRGPTPRVVVRDVDLTGIGYDLGDPGAPIQVVELSDFGCPYCASFALQTEPELVREFVATGQVYWKYVPFVVGMFPNGDAAALAVECAAEQGRFWPMRDSIYAHQGVWKRADDPLPELRRIATSAGVDGDRFGSCLTAGRARARTTRANNAATRLGVRATPTFFINGRMVEGALPLNVFRGGLRQMLEEEAGRGGG